MKTICVVGAGFSGSILAVRLAEAGARVVLIERGPAFGRGVAYSTPCGAHLLNVRAGRMSARVDDPDHFVRWLAEQGYDADPDRFVPRRVFGDYVQAILAQAEKTATGPLERVASEVVGVETGAAGARVRLADGAVIEADAVVLATGNPPPNVGGAAPGPGVITDPWAPGALDGVRPSDDVIILGTGLTAVDVAVALEERGWLGRATAISRRGLLPRAHDAQQPHVGPDPLPDASLAERLRWAKARAKARGWGEMMDALRANNAKTWAGLDEVQRARFLRHLRPWWDVHRHRTAKEVGDRIDSLIAQHRLTVSAGRIERLASTDGGVELTWRPRGEQASRTLAAAWAIDCTGPSMDPRRSDDPLTMSLLATGQGRADPQGIGFDVDADGRLIGHDGAVTPNLFALGPPSKAAHWEIIAVPDIRVAAQKLAERLAI